MDVLRALPRDTSHVRSILFALPLPFSLSLANYNTFWPLIDNVYSIGKSRDVAKPRPHKSRLCECRFRRARDVQAVLSSSQYASTTKRAVKSCDIAFRILEYPDHVSGLITSLERTC